MEQGRAVPSGESYYARNRERVLARALAYAAANREKIRARNRGYYAANREKERARKHASYHADPAKHKERAEKQRRAKGIKPRRSFKEKLAACQGSSDECWLWPGYVCPEGYGRYANREAHRVVWEHLRGAIPKRHHLHHKCGQSSCVNPDHLEPLNPEAHARLHRQSDR
jgi:hypothetical protein